MVSRQQLQSRSNEKTDEQQFGQAMIEQREEASSSGDNTDMPLPADKRGTKTPPIKLIPMPTADPKGVNGVKL